MLPHNMIVFLLNNIRQTFKISLKQFHDSSAIPAYGVRAVCTCTV